MSVAIEARIRDRLVEGQLPCAAAHVIAWEVGVPPQMIGQAADVLGIRISLCQLGLFGYGPKAEGKSKLMRRAFHVEPRLAERLQFVAHDNQLTCAQAWGLAAEMGIERLAVSDAAEALGFRIIQCQLGCF